MGVSICPDCKHENSDVAKYCLHCGHYLWREENKAEGGRVTGPPPGVNYDELDRQARKNQGGGCYIATACYGSYNAPEVMILRKYRDEKLASTPFGRLFISLYYKYSPYVAARLKGYKSVNTLIRKCILDKIVQQIRKNMGKEG